VEERISVSSVEVVCIRKFQINDDAIPILGKKRIASRCWIGFILAYFWDVFAEIMVARAPSASLSLDYCMVYSGVWQRVWNWYT
jgi:hypothetical protein